jgi:5-methylcytosine-specific restriction endonuclease McrA
LLRYAKSVDDSQSPDRIMPSWPASDCVKTSPSSQSDARALLWEAQRYCREVGTGWFSRFVYDMTEQGVSREDIDAAYDAIVGMPGSSKNARLGIESEAGVGIAEAASKRMGDEPAVSSRVVPSQCVICGQDAKDGRSLCDGRVYHDACYQGLVEASKQLQTAIEQARLRRAEHERAIMRAGSVGHKIRVFFGGKAIDVSRLRQQLSEFSQEGQRLEREAEQNGRRLRQLWDFWPEYPPDWVERQEAARTRAGSCELCPSTRRLHVHHRLRIGNGGNHRPENLQVLCENCHGLEHGRDFSGRRFRDGTRPGAYAQRLELLRSAIANQQAVRFSYRKFDGEASTRTFTPKLLKQVGQSLCVEGWCHLRNDTRSFAVRRMRGVKLAEGPKKVRVS